MTATLQHTDVITVDFKWIGYNSMHFAMRINRTAITMLTDLDYCKSEERN